MFGYYKLFNLIMTQQKRVVSLFSQFCNLANIKTTAKWNDKKRKWSNRFLKLDFNSEYGGYRMDWVEKDTSESYFFYKSRFSNKEMASYLQGLMSGYELKKYGRP